MDITSFALKRDKVTIVFTLLLFVYGLISFMDLPRAKDPGFIIRTATVVTYFPGASAKRVEQLVTDKLEKNIQEMPEIDFIKSTSKSGVSIIFVNILEKHKEMRSIWDSLRRKVDAGSRELPSGVSSPIVNDEFGDVYGTLISISSDGLSPKELEDIADDTKDVFLRLDEVAKINILGIQSQRVHIEFDNSKLASLNLSATYLKSILQSKNIVLSGGSIKVDSSRLSIEPSGNYNNLKEIENTLIPLKTGESIYLKDVAVVSYAYKDPTTYLVNKDGKNSLILAISMKEDGDIINLGKKIDELQIKVQSKLPLGVYLDRLFNEPKIVDDIISNFVSNLLQAMALVIIVMLLSLGLRSGLIVAVLIPMSILTSFIIMSTFDIWLDQVSLAALIISLGLLVDSAIVMSESIMVLMQRGKSVVDASIQSAKELRIPLLTSALTTSAAFLPIFLAKSTTGEYTASIFKVVTIVLLSSWVLALTLTPVLSKYFMKKDMKKHHEEGFIYKGYRKFLAFILNFRLVTIVVVITVFISSLILLDKVPKKFFPDSDANSLTVEIQLPVGTAIETTIEDVSVIEDFIREKYMKDENKEVINFVTFIGESAPRFWLAYNQQLASSEYSTILINAKDAISKSRIKEEIEIFAKSKFPDMQIDAKFLSNGPPISKPIEIRISGKDIDTLFEITSNIKQKLTQIEGVKNISDDWGLKNKKLIVNIDEAKALKEGISNFDIALSLQTALSGFEVTTFRKEDKLIPIVLRSNQSSKDSINALESINVYAQSSGKNIPLSQVASIQTVYEESKIIRRDRSKTVTIGTYVKDGYSAMAIFEEIKPWLDEYSSNFALGYYYSFGGEYEASGKANESIVVNIPIAFMIILLLMVTQFNSIRKPLIILSTIPLGMIGVSFGLYVMDSYFGFMTLLGVISLAGIVINNAIVLLERIKTEEEDNNRNAYDAIIEACISRFRPIFLTTITTVFGLIPLWYSGGPMWEPMAIAIIFGLMFSTILTLGFVPVLYSLLFKIKKQKVEDVK